MKTPEKLYANHSHNGIWQIDKDPNQDLGMIATVWNIDNDDGETARRLVLCWNACHGVSNEELQAADLEVSVLADVMRQRDQAEERIKELEVTIDSINGLGTLGKFFEALGWQGGTIHDAVSEVKRLADSDRRQKSRPMTFEYLSDIAYDHTMDREVSNDIAEAIHDAWEANK